ncbi:hypothetical protein [Dongia sp.]|uniref:hypothetical protein n=1 Tax=Dongia sp. TaxID=1977262 RepID=UPI0035B49596
MNRINFSLMVSAAIAMPLLGIGTLQADPRDSLPSQQVATTGSVVAPMLQHVPTPADVEPMSRIAAAVTPPLDISEAEARQWVADAGYTDISELRLATTADGAPVYQGTARADGKTYSVIVDSWGNIAGWQ